jgi:hypothetical protein
MLIIFSSQIQLTFSFQVLSSNWLCSELFVFLYTLPESTLLYNEKYVN